MKQRVITAVVALCLFIPIIVYGGWAIQLTGALLAAVGVYELFRMKGLDIVSLEGVLAIVGAVLLVLPKSPWFAFFPSSVTNETLFYLIVMLFLGISVFSKNTYTLDEAAFPVLVTLYVGTGFQNFVAARQNGAHGLVTLLYALFVVWSTDIGAYQIGKMYGKNKLAPSISPNKTIEGSIGGIVCAVIVSIIYFLLYPTNEFFQHGFLTMVVLTILFSIVGQLGDLVESAYKRHYGVKDSGNILPGHGGILDRFDSLLFVFPIMHLFGIF